VLSGEGGVNSGQMSFAQAQNRLLEWYRQNRRELPWRRDRDPYRIWISETMLQQTTTAAVIPYFERFIKRFPSLQALADADTGSVIEAWAGLGYYSRARNLHKAAQALHKLKGFPQTHGELAELPGFGPYTSRSVASLAFGEEVGVVDGNTIRVLSRAEGHDWAWWQNKVRAKIQERADAWVEGLPSNEMNQAMMELGRTICTPKSPSCLLRPLTSSCVSLKAGEVLQRPAPKPKRERELWLWRPCVHVKNNRLLIRRNDHVPFLKGQWLLPGSAKRLKAKPKAFDFRHSITHHDIFVTISRDVPKISSDDKWVSLKEIRQYVPASLVEKALARSAAGRGL